MRILLLTNVVLIIYFFHISHQEQLGIINSKKCTSTFICTHELGYFHSQGNHILEGLDCPINCRHCVSSNALPSSCTQCNQHFYISNEICNPCPQNCVKCFNQTLCLDCKMHFYLNQNYSCESCSLGCINSLSKYDCLSCGFNYSLTSKIQVGACNYGIPNCDICNQTVCFKCSDTYFPSRNGSHCQSYYPCQRCLNSSFCYTCPKSWIMVEDNKCQRCEKNCLVCIQRYKCVVCVSQDYLIFKGSCISPYALNWWEIMLLSIVSLIMLFIVGITIFKPTIGSQIMAIVLNNLIINNRNWLFWKEVAMLFFILSVAIFQIETQKEKTFSNPKMVLTFYNMLAIILISRASVMVHMDNRKKFLYFQKAYGLNSIVYILTWTFYSLLIGAIKMFLYIMMEYIYLKNNDDYFQKPFAGMNIPGTIIIGYSQFCWINFLTYISTYSYFLLMAVILSHNQLGLKLLTPILFVGFISSKQPTLFTQINMEKFVYSSPIGWLGNISYYRLMGPSFVLPQTVYLPVYFLQVFVPITLSFVIQFFKINRFQIKQSTVNKLKSIRSKSLTTQNISQHLINQESESSNLQDLQWLVKIQKLAKKSNGRKALNNINLLIYKSQIISLYGRNGSGKSTLFNILTNIDHATEGKIVFSRGIKIGISMEDNFFQDQLTVKQNLYFYARLKGVKIDKSSNDILQRFELIDFSEKKYYKISGGNRKKLSIACAFLGQNDIILLDSPTMGIDYEVKKDIQSMIIRQKEENKNLTIIISTCNIEFDFIDQISRVLVIESGSIILDQTIESINLEQQFIVAEIFNEKENQIQNFMIAVQRYENMKIRREKKKIHLVFSQKLLEKFIYEIKRFGLENYLSIWVSKVKDKLLQKLQQLNNQLTEESRNQQLNSLKIIYRQLQQKQSFVNLLLASIIIRFNQIIPNILDFLYFLIMPAVCWGYMVWLFNEEAWFNKNRLVALQFFIHFYPYLAVFMYSHIAVSHLKYKENLYETTIFKMGMKKIPYWLASFIINFICIYTPFILTIVIFGTNQYIQKISIPSILYFMVFTSVSYFFTLFYSSHYVCFSFLSVFLVTNLTYAISLLDYMNFYKQYIEQVSKILQIFVPNFIFLKMFSIQLLLLSLSGFAIYTVLYFITNQIIYRFKNSNKRMNSSQMMRMNYQGAIQQKLRVLDIVQNQEENANISLVISDAYLKYSKKIIGIKGFNLCVQRGSVFGLMGMNGSGKSTVIKLMINQVFKTIGNVYFDFNEIKSQTSQIYQNLSLCPQYDYLIPDMKVSVHLKIICALKGIKFTLQKQYIQSLLKYFKMTDSYNTKIKKLSNGNKRKLNIITSLLGKQKYLLLDEPTLGVDDQSERLFGQILMFKTDQLNSSSIYITHKWNQVDSYCKKLGIMKRGGLILSESSKDLVSKYSRGMVINLQSNRLKDLYILIQLMLKQKINVYECMLDTDQSLVKILIPFEQFDFSKCVDIIVDLRKNGHVDRYEMKRQGLLEVFDYIVHQSHQSNIEEPINS